MARSASVRAPHAPGIRRSRTDSGRRQPGIARRKQGSRLITGAGSRLGESLADRLAAAGFDLVLVARRRERLSQVAGRLGARGAAAEVLATDLSGRSEPNRVFERVNAGDL